MFHTIQEFEPTRLIWSHSFIALDNISPKMERYCFIGRMLKPVERDHFPAFYHEKIPPHETCLRIDTEIPRNTKEHIIGRGNYFLECLIGAANTKAKKVKIEINISGQWFDNEEEMFQKGFNIQVQDDP
jgi:hypothetical protein